MGQQEVENQEEAQVKTVLCISEKYSMQDLSAEKMNHEEHEQRHCEGK